MSNTKDENGVVRIVTTTSQANNSVGRRKTLKKLGIGGALVTSAKWTTPVIVSVSLPAHAQTSSTTTTTPAPGTTTTTTSPPGGTTTTTTAAPTTTPAPMGCSARTCSASSTAGFGHIGGLVFDGSGCFMQYDNGAAVVLLGDPNLIFFSDNNSSGSRIGVVGGANWSISGLSAPDQIFGPFGSGSESRTFTGTNNQTGDRFEFCLRVTRVGDNDEPTGIEHITYTVDIGPL